MIRAKKLIMLIVGICTIFCVAFAACKKQENLNYSVAGIWHAHAEWNEDNPYNYGGDNFTLDVYYKFIEDGTLKNRISIKLNNRTLSDTDWVIFNGSWTVNENTITLSNGKKFVIVDDKFNDTYPNPKIILHFFKEVDE